VVRYNKGKITHSFVSKRCGMGRCCFIMQNAIIPSDSDDVRCCLRHCRCVRSSDYDRYVVYMSQKQLLVAEAKTSLGGTRASFS